MGNTKVNVEKTADEKLQPCINILKEYLDLKYKGYEQDKESFPIGKLDDNINFMADYCICRNMKDSKGLLGLYEINSTYTKYFGEKEKRTFAGRVKDEIQYMFDRLGTKDDDAFNGSFPEFMAWWVSKLEKNTQDKRGLRKCCYCGVYEDVTYKAFNEIVNGKTLLSSKKPGFNGEMQIERKNPNGKYEKDNCEFACVLCNNAKSDMISEKDFKRYWADGIKNYWEEINSRLPKDE